MNTPITHKYASFIKDLSNYIQTGHGYSIDNIGSETKSLFDRACETTVTSLNGMHSSHGFSYEVHRFFTDEKTKSFFDRTVAFFNPKTTLDELAKVYNTYYGDNISSKSLFTLMLKDGNEWESAAKSLQAEVWRAHDESTDLVIKYTFFTLLATIAYLSLNPKHHLMTACMIGFPAFLVFFVALCLRYDITF